MAKKKSNSWQKKPVALKATNQRGKGGKKASKKQMLRAIAHYVLQRGGKKGSLTKNKKWAKRNNARMMRERGKIVGGRKKSRTYKTPSGNRVASYSKKDYKG